MILCNVGNFFDNSYNCALLTIDESEFFLNDLDFIIYPILSCSICFILEFFKNYFTYYLLFFCICYCLYFGVSILWEFIFLFFDFYELIIYFFLFSSKLISPSFEIIECLSLNLLKNDYFCCGRLILESLFSISFFFNGCWFEDYFLLLGFYG